MAFTKADKKIDTIFRSMAFDPGTETLGVAVFDADIDTLEIKRSLAFTLHATRLLGNDHWGDQFHGNRFGRTEALKRAIYELLVHHCPLIVSSEAPFINRFRPQAYGPLVETIYIIRQAVTEYEPHTELYLIDPPSVKIGVGAGRHAKKDEVKEKVTLLKDLNYQGSVPLASLDEHSIDSLAVGYTRLKRFRG